EIPVLVDVGDVQPDLIDVPDDREPRAVAGAGHTGERGSERVASHLLGEARARLAPYPRGIGLVTRGTWSPQQAREQLGYRHQLKAIAPTAAEARRPAVGQ